MVRNRRRCSYRCCERHEDLFAALTVSLGLAAMVGFFFLLEAEQVRLSRLFGARSQRIEEVFADPSGARRRFPAPYIASAIFEQSQRLSSRRSRDRVWWKLWPLRTSAILHSCRSWRNRTLESWKLWRSAHILFYGILMLLSFAPVGARYPALIRHMNELRSDIHLFLDPIPPPAPNPPGAPTIAVKK